MPTYQYACTECEHTFEQVQSFSDDALTECPQCHGRLRKLFNAVGVVFKGSGFYRTDSRADARTAAASASSSNGSSTNGSSTNGASSNGGGASSDSGSGDSASKTPAKSTSDSSSGSSGSSGSSSGSGEKKSTAAAS